MNASPNHQNYNKIIRWIMLGFSLFYIIVIFVFVFRSAFSWVNLTLALGIVCTHSLRHYRFQLEKPYRLYSYILPLIEVILLDQLIYGHNTGVEGVVFMILTVDIIVTYKSWFSIPFLTIGHMVYMVFWEEYQRDYIDFLIELFNYSLFTATTWGAKVLLTQRETIIRLNKKVIEQSSAMEDMAKLKERNRIAEEVHDTVGHKLTTAIVSLEGANLLFEKKPDEAHKKLSIARKQLKEGLSDIRKVVRDMKATDQIKRENSLKASIEQIVHDVELQTGISVHLEYSLEKELLSLQEHVLLNAIQEGITNAMKHAGALHIDISVMRIEGQVKLVIENDGQGCEKVKEGFGLVSMKANVEAIGGKMSITCNPTRFVLSINLPIVEE